MTTLAIIGLGNMGKGLARRLAGKIDLLISTRELATAEAFAASLPGGRAKALTTDAAIAGADIVLLAMPYAKALEAAANPALAGKVVVDMSNPITPDFANLLLGFDTSAAETIQAAAPQAKVVKAYNTIFAALLDQPVDQTENVPVFLAGNDTAAVAAVADLVLLSGFAAEATGGLETSRLLEPLGLLNIKFGYGLGQGTTIAPAWVRLPA